MSGTTAVPSDYLAKAARGGSDGRPLCPACSYGRLHPYKVTIGLQVVHGWSGADYLTGWVAVCQGAKAGENFIVADQPPCGFTLPMTPHTYEQDRRKAER